MKLNHFEQTVRVAVLGLGSRGISQMNTLLEMKDVDVTSVCDSYRDRAEQAADIVAAARGRRPFATTDQDAAIDRADVDAVIIMTSWETHIPLAIRAMRCGKRPAMEAGGAASVEECWQLIRASEETGIPVMLLENCCYGSTELTLLHMIHEGVFGTVVHCAGAYSHDLRDEIGNGDVNRHYRQRHFLHRNGELGRLSSKCNSERRDLFHGFLDNGAPGQAFNANEPPGAARGWLAHQGYACPAHCQGTFAA